MFGYGEDISVAPGLSDFQGQRGFMCHVTKYTQKKGAEERLGLLAMQGNAV